MNRTPNLEQRQGGVVFNMTRFTKEKKLEIYELSKKGVGVAELSITYGMKHEKINYLVRLIDQYGVELLERKKNRYYSPEFKLCVINRILENNESINSVSIELGLRSGGTIYNWIKKYKENGYNVIEKKRGRVPMTKAKEITKDEITAEEKVKELEKRLQYVEAENEYLKKLNVVVKQRVEREKKKRQK